jgi:hypothetical protein
MKNIFLIAVLFSSFSALGQDHAKHTMESRAREMIRVLGLTDKGEYRKFIKANYTEALINKKMRLNVQGGPGGAASETEKTDPVDDKVNMYARLHDDLGEGKIISMKQTGEKLDVEAQGSTGASMNFVLTYQKVEPFLIDGFSVQMVMGR